MRYVFVLETSQEPDISTKQRIMDMLTSLGAGLVSEVRTYHGEVENEHLLTDPNDLASSKQIWFLEKLVKDADAACQDSLGTERGERIAEAWLAVTGRIAKGSITKSEASQLIDTLKLALES
jgi:deoxyadenosine/deoxycytidine kinase